MNSSAVRFIKPSQAFDTSRAVILAVVEANEARNPRAFGSVVRREDKEQSDIDLLFDTTPKTMLFDIAAIELDLERLMGVPVHLTTRGALKGRLRERILAEPRAA